MRTYGDFFQLTCSMRYEADIFATNEEASGLIAESFGGRLASSEELRRRFDLFTKGEAVFHGHRLLPIGFTVTADAA